MFGATCTGPARFVYRIERAKRDIWYTSELFLHNWHFQCHRLIASSTTTLERKKNTRDKIGVSRNIWKIKIEHENWTREFRWFVATNKTKRHRNPVHSCAVRDGRGCAHTPKMDRDVESRFHRSVCCFVFFTGLPRPAKDRDDVDWRRLHVADRLSLHVMECLHPPPAPFSNSHFQPHKQEETEGEKKNSSTLPWCRKIPASSWSYTLAPICLFDFSCFSFNFSSSSFFILR